MGNTLQKPGIILKRNKIKDTVEDYVVFDAVKKSK